MGATWFFFVDELAFATVCAFTRGLNVPLLAMFGLKIFVALSFVVQLMDAMGVSTFKVKLTNACLYEIVAELCLVVQPKVFNILTQSLSTWEVHLLLWPVLGHIQFNIWEH